MNREKLIDIINDTIYQCENRYNWMIEDAKNIYYPENYFKVEINNNTKNKAIINLIKKTTVEALEIYGLDKVYAVLNFASAKHPGGGVLKGTIAQEEALSRASSLYPVIKQCTDFYGYVQAPYYTDKIIYSKPIYVFKNDYGQDIEPIKCEVITCAAPNYSFCDVDLSKHVKIMTVRFTKVIKSAIENNQRNLLLGAWGCGVFKNPADINAQIFRQVLDNYSSYFDDIIFAIPDNTNYEIFKENLY
jgi:uncharacterized protein (TIGR02452 family)